jgi:hypothetical protein
MNNRIPVPCQPCQGTGLRQGAQCRECDGNGYRLMVDGKLAPNSRREAGAGNNTTSTNHNRPLPISHRTRTNKISFRGGPVRRSLLGKHQNVAFVVNMPRAAPATRLLKTPIPQTKGLTLTRARQIDWQRHFRSPGLFLLIRQKQSQASSKTFFKTANAFGSKAVPEKLRILI